MVSGERPQARRAFVFALACALVCAVFLGLPKPAFAAIWEGIIVSAENGAPLQNVQVWCIRDAPGGSTTDNTDVLGHYEFDNPAFFLPGSQYKIAPLKAGYRTWESSWHTYTGADLGGLHIRMWSQAHRMWGHDRFATATTIARETWSSFGMGGPVPPNIIIASGDDRAAADPLAASGLAWAYDAPVLLVSATRTPHEVKEYVADAVAVHGAVVLHVVGGPVSVPQERIDEIVAYAGGWGPVVAERILSTGSRYDLAAAILDRMKFVESIDPSKTMTSRALVANGADSEKFFDALALSPIAANNGAPILLVRNDEVPTATRAAIEAFDPARIIVGGGPMTVSDDVLEELDALALMGAERWSGHTRYDTAVVIAEKAVGEGALVWDLVGVAAKLPDAVTGGAATGLQQGPILLTNGTSLTEATRLALERH
ncbi:MAG: cell wall-binding repeat-containing protein [Coriobacteriia bacterium]|nr:cell wall-binding repeat-containing protein [Coriobacteriia bacterium]